YASASTLIDLCRATGHEGYWCPRDADWPVAPPPTAGGWVGGMLDDSEAPSLDETRKSLPAGVPLIVLLDFPRRAAVTTALRLGATNVLGKPWRAEHVIAAIQARCFEESVRSNDVA